VKNESRIFYVAHSNDFRFLYQVTSDFLGQAKDIELREEYSKKQKGLLVQYQELIYVIQQLQPLLFKQGEMIDQISFSNSV